MDDIRKRWLEWQDKHPEDAEKRQKEFADRATTGSWKGALWWLANYIAESIGEDHKKVWIYLLRC